MSEPRDPNGLHWYGGELWEHTEPATIQAIQDLVAGGTLRVCRTVFLRPCPPKATRIYFLVDLPPRWGDREAFKAALDEWAADIRAIKSLGRF